MERTDAEAEELIREFCDDAYVEAIRRENEASSDAIAEDWSRVALAVAHKLRTSTEVDPSERRRVDEPKRTISAKPQQFRSPRPRTVAP
jgi:hypothetical protein